MNLRLLPIGLCLATTAIVAAVSAQVVKKPAPAARKVPAAPTAKADDVILASESAIWDDAENIGQLSRNVRVSQVGQDLNLFAQQLLYNKKLNRARATGNLVITTRSSTIRGALIEANFDTKMITITGNVTVTTHGKTDGITGNRQDLRTEFRSKSSTIRCQRVDWDYEDRQATLIGNLTMTQGANRGTCERILYDEEKNVARLKGGAVFTDEKNRTFKSPDITVYIDEGKIVTNGGILRFPRLPSETTPKPVKTRVLTVQPAPVISAEDAKLFGITPLPIPTPRPEPTEVPIPTPPSEPEEAAPDAADAAPAARR